MSTAAETATTRTDLPDFLWGFAAMHDAMRRDAARLCQALEAPLPARRAAGLARWYDRFNDIIDNHHRLEDTVMWPALRQRAPGFATAEQALADDHVELDRRLHAVRDALASLAARPADTLARSDASAAAAALDALLHDHLAREEEAAFPRIAQSYTAEEYEVLEKEVLKGTSPRRLAFEVPWVLDGVPAEQVTAVMAAAPAVLRVLNRLVFARSYRRIAAPLLDVRS